jgi:hypothetical protein
MNEIFKNLDIDPKIIKHSKVITKKAKFDKVKDSVPAIEDYNFQMDYLELPETKLGFNRLLVIVDLANDEVDFEPTKNKDSNTTLKAMKTIFKRPYLNKPYASIRTDSGTEFLGDVKKYLYNESILHRPGISGRHKQTGNVEMANKQIAIVLNAYMNTVERKTGAVFKEWTDIIDQIRPLLNNFRKKKLIQTPIAEVTDNINPKFNIGDLVYRKLDKPKDARGYDQDTQNFRAGDMRWEFLPRSIEQIFYYPNNIRYQITGLKNVSYTEDELIEAEEEEELFDIREIIDHKMIKKKLNFKVWWLGELKKDATWEPADKLIEDGLEEYIDFYKEKNKNKKKKK